MIKSFKCKKSKSIWVGNVIKSFAVDLQLEIRRKLRILNNAQVISDLLIPAGNKLKKLSGDRQGQYSIRINQQWRICFSWYQNNAYDVEIVDYH